MKFYSKRLDAFGFSTMIVDGHDAIGVFFSPLEGGGKGRWGHRRGPAPSANEIDPFPKTRPNKSELRGHFSLYLLRFFFITMKC